MLEVWFVWSPGYGEPPTEQCQAGYQSRDRLSEQENLFSIFFSALLCSRERSTRPFTESYIFGIFVPSQQLKSRLPDTTGFYMAKLDEIGHTVCSSSSIDVYEQ